MGDVTDLYQIPYITDEDLVENTPSIDQAQAERIDYLFSVNTGPDGKSAYDVYVDSVQPPDVPLSEEDWLESLNADVGASAYDKLLPAHQEPVELSNTTFGHLLPHTSHAPLNYYPIGTVIEWAGMHVDNGWLWCDGKAYDYTVAGNEDLGALYSTIGQTYGGSGSMFAVPDKRIAANKSYHIIYAGGDTSAVTSNWQNPNVGEHLGGITSKLPVCKASGTTTVPAANDTTCAFTKQHFDTDGIFTPTSTDFTIQTAGVYLFTAEVNLNDTSNVRADVYIQKNGSGWLARTTLHGIVERFPVIVADDASVGDVYTVRVHQNNSVNASKNVTVIFTALWQEST